MPNRLADATSPYLLQHADNPVDWHEWGSAAFAEAVERGVPVILSVGYSACHWCHVMAHESFENDETAAYMNEHFVSIKVDREERPDVDRIYMDAVTATTGRGGWPMTVFITPEAKPFYAGTYFPNEAHHGMPSFMEVLRSVTDAWASDRDDLIARSEQITDSIGRASSTSVMLPSDGELDLAVDTIAASFDPSDGGFGRAPKFPQPSPLEFLLRYAVLRPQSDRTTTALQMVEVTLDHMARGGIYDHLDGGFARYSVDDVWLVPHFEKMLYDNALLARLYLHAWQVTGLPWMLQTARETLDYLARDMMDESGGIHSAEDADAGGTEGAFSVWTWAELADTLGDDLSLAADVYGATQTGNFEGANILHLPVPLSVVAGRRGLDDAELLSAKQSMDDRLRKRRGERTRPGRDDKVVTAWNGLALRAFAEAAAVLGDDGYLTTARGIAEFLLGPASSADGLLRSWRKGRNGPAGFADDYAAAALGLFSLYQTTGDERWYVEAERLTGKMIRRFADDSGGFFATASDGESLIARPKNVHDSPTPSDNALAAEALAVLAAYEGDHDLYGRFERTIQSVGTSLSVNPAAHGQLLAVWLSNPLREVAVIGEPTDRRPLLETVWERYRPDTVVAQGDGAPSLVPLLEGRTAPDGARAFVCRGFVCDVPAESAPVLKVQLDEP